MSDRALYARWLYREIVSLGLAPCDADHQAEPVPQGWIEEGLPVTALVPRLGCRWQGRGVAFPKKPERRLECTLMACWEPGYDEPWFLVTDLAADQAEGLWYGMRSWIEGGFKLLKSGGWEWQATRMTDPDRVERLWLVLAVATLYVLAVGGEADEAEFASCDGPRAGGPTGRGGLGRPPASSSAGKARPRRRVRRDARPAQVRKPRRRRTGTKQRLVSIFHQGLAVLMSVLIAGHALPRPSWKPEAWLEIRGQIKRRPNSPRLRSPKTPPSKPVGARW